MIRVELKKAIINYIFDNLKQVQLLNLTISHFSEYIYNREGEYLIGGEDVSVFIDSACKLITEKR